MYIYTITNMINGKKYVGQTIQSLASRWNNHKQDTKCPNFVIHIAMDKYGIENFKFEAIDESATNIDELNDLEEFYILFYNTFRGNGYNMTSGGEGYLISDETRKKMSQSKIGNIINLGKTHSKETKRKISESNKGNTNCVGYKHTKEAKKNMSEYHQGRTGIQSKNSKKVIQIDKDTGEEIACWFSMNEIRRELNVSDGEVSKCCNNKAKSAGGYIWKFL